MELIEVYEKTKRGIFSGALGYITPEGDFDFNVVIRSIVYNSLDKYLSMQGDMPLLSIVLLKKNMKNVY
jgi:para-aminobenzoate synthetase component 1